MSAYGAGRPKVELREAKYIWNGTRILLGEGIEFTVESFESNHPDDDRHDDTSLVFHLVRYVHGEKIELPYPCHGDANFRCRVEDEDR